MNNSEKKLKSGVLMILDLMGIHALLLGIKSGFIDGKMVVVAHVVIGIFAIGFILLTVGLAIRKNN
jgi:hypothetical protein